MDSLSLLASYTTPTQSQATNDPEQRDNDSQKRKRPGKNPSPKHRVQKPPNNTPESTTQANTSQVEDTTRNQLPNIPNAPPNQTPPSDISPPDYNLPQFNRPNSPPPPPSPSTEAVKRRKILDQNRQNQQNQPSDQNQDQSMAVDDENMHPTDQRNTPTRGKGDSWQDKTPTRQQSAAGIAADAAQVQGEDVFVEVDEEENAKTMARVMNMDGTPEENDHLSPHPHDKFTRGPIPRIFDEDPATLLAGVERNQLQSWLDLPTGKVLARPFDIEVRYKPNHSAIANTLRTVAKEITGATKVTVAIPKRDPNLPKNGTLRHPMTFLIHDISRKDAEVLLTRTVWSSKEITFQVSSINVRRPDFLFTMKGMTTDKTEHVLACVGETWNDATTNDFIHKLARRAPSDEEQQIRLGEMIDFLESAAVSLLDMKSEGGQEDPHYNVYADGEVIENNTTWLELRRFLRGRIYRSNYHGDGKATDTDYICSLCHGHDHPRGLCSFPHLPGWNGGGRNPKRLHLPEQYDNTEHHVFSYSTPRGAMRARGSSRGRFHDHGRGRGRGNPPTRYPPY
jgi:hypothetical protein